MQENGWLIAIAALAVSCWNAWNSWRKEVSRLAVTVVQPPFYNLEEGVLITALYRGGPPIKVISARIRVVRVRGVRWFEWTPEKPEAAVLKPENREVRIRASSDYRDRFWYVDVIAEAGIRKRKYLRCFPPIWLWSVELGTYSLAEHGAIPIPGRFAKSLKELLAEARREAERKKKDGKS